MLNKLQAHFASHFAEATLTSLVETFNAQVRNRGFNSARAAHDQALLAEFVSRGIDISGISDGTRTSFAHHVALNDSATKLILTD